MRWRGSVAAIALLVAVAACATPPLNDAGPNVGDVVQRLPDETPTAAPAPDAIRTDTAVKAYHRVEDTLPDAADNRSIDRRIADLERRFGTERGGTAGAQRRDDILYQLAESYDLLGDSVESKHYLDRLIDEHPDSDHRIEARFRRAEIEFSGEDYDDAALDYQYVVEQGAASNFWLNADYMLGWTYLKQGAYARSLDRFLDCVQNMLAGGEPDAGTRQLLDDTLRAIVLDLTNLDGPAALAEHLDAMHKPDWQWRVYARLAEDWRHRQRYLDSVATLETFVSQNPYDARAPEFSVQAIDTLVEADFPDEVRKHKQAFIERYRFDSEYWTVNGKAARDKITPVYKRYLMEVAKLAHSDGQRRHATDAYLQAAAYYQQYADTFPRDASAGEARFLQGEALTEAGHTEPAVTAYQQVVHVYPKDPHAPDAAYAAILGLDTLQRTATPDRQVLLQRTKIDAQIEYATLFPKATHAAEAQAAAADALFALHEYADAARLAQDLLTSHRDLPPALKRVATLILAQIAFDEAHYDVAEAHYRDVIRLSTGADAAAVQPRLLASIYKQGQAAEARGDVDAAMRNYLRIADDDPGGELAARAHFDAVAVCENAGRFRSAADLLKQFQSRYPNNPLAADTDTRLAGLYEKASRPRDAATALRRVAAANPGTEKGRQALYHAGELYTTVDVERAIDSFTIYQRDYVDPPDLALEAVEHLDELAERGGDDTAHVRWLKRKIELTAAMGDAPTDRARYLAAAAQFELAGRSRADFDAIELRGDLARHLAAKRAALKQTVDAFERSAAYGVDEFATGSTFEIADTYAALARAVLESSRPTGLTELEREQYDVLLEEQAEPFEEKAIAIHAINAGRVATGTYDRWVVKSLAALRVLAPARYDRPETDVGFIDSIR